jgi:glycine/D-amino acid oxidase-like deaminating enzyme
LPSEGLTCGMRVDVIVIGQGISGTFLSYYLQQAGRSFIIIDQQKPSTASKTAAGIINPVTGRRIVNTWMIDELLPFAKKAYDQLESETGINCLSEKNIVDFFPAPQMRNAFLDRMATDDHYLHMPEDENAWRDHFNYDFGFGVISPSYLIDVTALLSFFREKFIREQVLRESHFDLRDLVILDSGIRYQDIGAAKIIFCDGIQSVSNPYFQNLPFAPNKGEALIASIKGFPANHVFKRGMSIVPWKNDLFWIGSSYEWEFQDEGPSPGFRAQAESILRNWLKADFMIMDHLAAIRPATLERRPFVGFHPGFKNLGLLNGMGTKGCSLAPFFAKQMVDHLVHGIPIQREANLERFTNILQRK